MIFLFFKVVPDTCWRKKGNPWQETDMEGVGLRVRDRMGKPLGSLLVVLPISWPTWNWNQILIPVCPFPAWCEREDTVHFTGLL